MISALFIASKCTQALQGFFLFYILKMYRETLNCLFLLMFLGKKLIDLVRTMVLPSQWILENN